MRDTIEWLAEMLAPALPTMWDLFSYEYVDGHLAPVIRNDAATVLASHEALAPLRAMIETNRVLAAAGSSPLDDWHG